LVRSQPGFGSHRSAPSGVASPGLLEEYDEVFHECRPCRTARLGDDELLQIVEQRLCRLEVSGAKSLGKPAIDGRYEISRLPNSPLAAP
jgi:hypothetical protein